MILEILKIASIVVGISVGIINVIVAYKLLTETKKLREVSTKPELVFSLVAVEHYIVVGRLKNIGNGIAYNIEVKSDIDFQIFSGYSLSTAFRELKYLAPNQYFDISYGHINIKNEIINFKNHTLEISWTDTKEDLGIRNTAKFFLSKKYFKNAPRPFDFTQVTEAIERLREEIAKKKC